MQSDSRLLKLFRRGLEPAFDELVRRYRTALVSYAALIAGRDRAEDVVQDSLVKAHRSLAGDQAIDPKPWLYTIVKNTALNDIRDNAKHGHAELGETSGRVAPTHEVAERREELATVVAAVSELPESQRKALIGHELGGYTHQEIATELKLSTGAAKQLIYRARLSVRNAVGAMIPVPLIAWLLADAGGVYATGAATGVAAGGAIGAATTGGGVGAAGTGGFFAGLAGMSAAKVAVVAVVAGGSIATGVAVEKHQTSTPSTTAQASAASTSDGGNGPSGNGTGDGTGSIAAVSLTDGKLSSGDTSKKSGSGSDDSGSGVGDDTSTGDKPATGTPDDGSSNSGTGGGGQTRPPTRDGSTKDSGQKGSGDDDGPDDDGGSGSDGGDRPSGGGDGSGSGGSGGGGSHGSTKPPVYVPPENSGGDDVYVAPIPKPKPEYKPESGSSGSGDSGSEDDSDDIG